MKRECGDGLDGLDLCDQIVATERSVRGDVDGPNGRGAAVAFCRDATVKHELEEAPLGWQHCGVEDKAVDDAAKNIAIMQNNA